MKRTALTITLLVEDNEKAMELQMALQSFLSRVYRRDGEVDSGVVARLAQNTNGVVIISTKIKQAKP